MYSDSCCLFLNLCEHIFYTQLLPELKSQGKTILVISHDDHYFHLADRIIKLDYGKIEFDQLPQN